MHQSRDAVSAASVTSSLPCRTAAEPDASWRTVELTLPAVTFQLPPGWHERRWNVGVGQVESWHTFRAEADVLRSLNITEEPGSTAGALPGVTRQPGYTDFVECSDRIGGHRVLLQTWRGGGTVFRDGQQTPVLATRLTLEVAPGRYAMVSATSGDAAGQDEIIAILKTFRVRPIGRKVMRLQS